jgi:hypothetical protein
VGAAPTLLPVGALAYPGKVAAPRRRAALLTAIACAACTDIGDPAGGGRPDAAPHAADAAPAGPDASAPVTLVLGESDGADLTGVTTDTTIDSGNPTLNYGASVTFRADADPSRVALLRFDVAAIAPGAAVSFAELALTTAADALEQGSLQIFEVTESWSEGDGDGTAAAANWSQRTASDDWTTAGAGTGSRATTATTELIPSAVTTRYTFPLPTDFVQRWVDQPDSNRGLVLVPVDAGTHGVNFESSESATAAARPTLTITYTP